MFKLAGKIIDAHDLIGSPLEAHKEQAVRLLQQAPPFVKEARLLDPEQIERLPDAFFGLILTEKTASRRLFPVPDWAHAWLQLAALESLADALPPEIRKVAGYHLKQAARRHGLEVSEKIEAIASDEPCPNRLDVSLIGLAAVKTAAEEDGRIDADFALVIHGRRRYPIHTPELVKQAMDYFDQFELSFALPRRYAFARNVKAKAEEFGVSVSEKVAAGAADTYAEALDSMLDLRRRYATDGETQALDLLARNREPLDAVKFAELLYEWDQATQVAQRHRLPHAFASTLGQVKEAGPTGLAVETLIRGVVKHEEKLAKYLGSGMVEQLKAHPAETYEALGEDAQEVLHQVIAGAL